MARYPGTRNSKSSPVGSRGMSYQGATVACPWSSDSKTLGRPKAMKAEGPQGEASMSRGVRQGKFTGEGRFARNTKQKAAQALPMTAWPNPGTVWKGRLR